MTRSTPDDPRPDDLRPDDLRPSSGAPLDAEQALRSLAEADRLRASAPRASLPSAFITYAVLCVVGSMTTIGLRLAGLMPETPGFSPKLAVLVSAFTWIFVGILPSVLVRDVWRRGFARRWVVMILLWSLLWIAAVTLAETRLALVIAPLFLVLFMIALTSEIAARTKSVGAGHARSVGTRSGGER
ncbi:hypothetical protein Bequi_05055 [Brachybacterium sp. JHP9]|uniref:MFS transporter n=1 Tax=Brachybacterium equifaecis TaxID=2910770 RepID=A0ABT0QYL6_9MICO|nr:hypothetical protein [Brachybacterium equifaecis]MCL6422760.1 hypothetical protein [Brachybacterium equifaecis]